MRRIRALACSALLIGCAVASSAVAGGAPRNARIAGRVVECNAPNHCFYGHFDVSAINSADRTVATTHTTPPHSSYRMRVPADSYKLVAESRGGLKCRGSAVAVAHQTTHQNITCLVP